ncbi:MAG: hypothetical protein GEU78_16680, partial [Actinobacteria bacterium]|nr:hypothetical protein [Actinomycetota bacterium]
APVEGDTKTYTYAYDVHGSVSLLLENAAGDSTADSTVKAAYGYDAYGEEDKELTSDPEEVTGASGTDDPLNAYRYTAKRFDSGSGTLDMGARRFGPDTARFLQPDLFKGALANLGLSSDPITGNRYALAGGNPLSYIEWDGHAPLLDGHGGAVDGPTAGPGGFAGGGGVSGVFVDPNSGELMTPETAREHLANQDASPGFWEGFSPKDATIDAGRGFSNFSTEYVNSATEMLSFGLMEGDIPLPYKGAAYQPSAAIGRITPHIQATAATAGAAVEFTVARQAIRADIAALEGSLAAGRATRAVPEATSRLLRPGPYAAESIPARSASQSFSAAERAAIDDLGYRFGCHTCGTISPGTKSGHFIPDHMPVSALNWENAAQRLYPQCLACSREQGLAVARLLQILRGGG